MIKMTIEKAFELREALKSDEYTRGERMTIEQIVYGSYDKYKDEKKVIAKEDLDFIDKEHRELVESIKKSEQEFVARQ